VLKTADVSRKIAQSFPHLSALSSPLASLANFILPFGGQLSRDNHWIKLAEIIPWDELKDYYAAQF